MIEDYSEDDAIKVLEEYYSTMEKEEKIKQKALDDAKLSKTAAGNKLEERKNWKKALNITSRLLTESDTAESFSNKVDAILEACVARKKPGSIGFKDALNSLTYDLVQLDLAVGNDAATTAAKPGTSSDMSKDASSDSAIPASKETLDGKTPNDNGGTEDITKTLDTEPPISVNISNQAVISVVTEKTNNISLNAEDRCGVQLSEVNGQNEDPSLIQHSTEEQEKPIEKELKAVQDSASADEVKNLEEQEKQMEDDSNAVENSASASEQHNPVEADRNAVEASASRTDDKQSNLEPENKDYAELPLVDDEDQLHDFSQRDF